MKHVANIRATSRGPNTFQDSEHVAKRRLFYRFKSSENDLYFALIPFKLPHAMSIIKNVFVVALLSSAPLLSGTTLAASAKPASSPGPEVSANLARRDLNDDGKSDIIWRNSSTGANWYWAMNGTSILDQGPITTLPSDWQIQGTSADFDGDGKSDILLRNMTTGQPWVWLMNGYNILGGGPLPILADLNWTIAGTGDLNGDGKGDIIWRNINTGQNWWWALNGTNIINQGPLTTLPPQWQIQSTQGDFNGDGKTDILWRDMTTGLPWVWIMDGNTVSSSGPLPQLSDLNWLIAGTGDLNGDGKHDVVWRNSSTGENWYWALNGNSIISQGPITALSAEWTIQGTSADFDGDGKTDILLRNMTTGQPWMWLMNGNTITGGGPLPALNDFNWQIRTSENSSAANCVIRNKATLFPDWVAGNAYNTANPPLAIQAPYQIYAYRFNLNELLDSSLTSGATGAFQLYEALIGIGHALSVSVNPCEFTPSATAVQCQRVNQTTGSFGLRYAHWNHPASDALLVANNFCRLQNPGSQTYLYVNVRIDQSGPNACTPGVCSYYPLYVRF